jgi:hypothetical protein
MRRWIGLTVALGVAACQAAPPSMVRLASTNAHNAADDLVKLAAAAPAAPPRAADPKAAPLFDAVFNTAPAQAATPAWDDLDAVNDWLLSTVRVGQTYILAGTGLTDINQVANNQAAQAQVERNLQTYGPELGRFFDAELTLEGAEAATASAYLAAHPAQSPDEAQGLDKVRAGITQTAASIIETLADPTTGNPWREARAQALVAFAGRAGPLLTAAQRQQLAQAATQVATQANDPQLGLQLNQFAAAITKGG